MDPTDCRLCGARRGEHFHVLLGNRLSTIEVCPTAVYTPVKGSAPVLELDKMPVHGAVPGSPAAEGKTWNPATNSWEPKS